MTDDDDTGTDIYLPWEIRMNRERHQDRLQHWGLWLALLLAASWVILGIAIYAVLP